MAFKQDPNKVDFIAQEHEVLDFWKENRSFEKNRELHKGQQPWSFIDGPITANNPMGVHHGWGRTYKDLYNRFWTMKGRELRYQNGFDCQGLWVEVEVEKEKGFASKKDIETFGLDEFVKLCKARVLKYAGVQSDQSIRLGYWMEWNDSEKLNADFRMDEASAYPRLYMEKGARATADQAITLLQGRAVGGSTVVNWTTCYRLPDRVLLHWASAHGVEGLSPVALAPHFAAVEERLHVHEQPLAEVNPNNRVLWDGAQKLDQQRALMRRNVRGCANLGNVLPDSCNGDSYAVKTRSPVLRLRGLVVAAGGGATNRKKTSG